MTLNLLIQMSVLFAAMFIVGTMLCLPIYHFSVKKFAASSLWTKIVWWIPIFVIFCGVLYGRTYAAWMLVCLLILLAARELMRQKFEAHIYTWIYAGFVSICLLTLPFYFILLPYTVAVQTLISVCFASVLSDVCAFFAGTYGGRHKLPKFINPGKSYEGVAGQVIGGVCGMGLAAALPGIGFSWTLALAVGIASAAGDLMNSVAKRQLGIKDWGDTIPGHGGILDRFSSMSVALTVGLLIIHVKI